MAETARKIDAQFDEEDLANVSGNRENEAWRWFKDFYRREGLDKTALAKRLGFGKEGRTPVSNFLSRDDHPGASFARIVLAVERLRSTVDGPEGIAKWVGFQQTRCVDVIWKHANAARDGHLLAAVVGPIGAGKTEALREYQRHSRHDGKAPVRFIRCRVTMNLPALVRKLAIDMGLIESGGDPAALHEQIVRKLSGYPEFLIFDEVDYLTYNDRSLQFLRDLHDETGTGILLSGQLYFLNQIWGRADFAGLPKMDDSTKRVLASGSLAPFADRLSVEIAPGLDNEEIIDIAEEKLDMTLAPEAAEKLTFYVNHNFRVLCQLLRVMRDKRIKSGKSVDQRVIEAAWLESQHIKAKQ